MREQAKEIKSAYKPDSGRQVCSQFQIHADPEKKRLRLSSEPSIRNTFMYSSSLASSSHEQHNQPKPTKEEKKPAKTNQKTSALGAMWRCRGYQTFRSCNLTRAMAFLESPSQPCAFEPRAVDMVWTSMLSLAAQRKTAQGFEARCFVLAGGFRWMFVYSSPCSYSTVSHDSS